MNKLHSLLPLAFFALAGSAALAQTLYVPGGSVGSSTTGGIGIGTASPQAGLDVTSGGIGVHGVSYTTGGPALELNVPSSNLAQVMSVIGSTRAINGLGIWGNPTTFYGDGSTNNPIMTLLPSGNVGIGTTAPGNKLHLRATAGWFQAIFENLGSGTDAGGIQLRNNGTGNSNQGGYLIMGGTGNPFTSYKQRLSLISYANASAGTGSKGITIGWEGASDGAQDFRITNGTDLSNTLLIVNNSGNVGIGTTSPRASLEVFANTSSSVANIMLSAQDRTPRIRFNGPWSISNPAESYAQIVAVNDNGGPGNSAASLHFYTSSGDPAVLSDKMVVTGSGNVGIGTTNPTYRLSVVGTVRAQEVIVDTGWSDYVFKPEYRLAPLHEVEKTIATEGHLPGIPSAKEVAEHGISVGDMQARLLAKVEELTLHVIEQEKRQERLAQTVAHLQQENAALRTELTALQKP